MAYIKPLYTKAEVDAAGAILIKPDATAGNYERALSIIDNWRQSHNFPLNTFQMWLRRKAKTVDASSIVVQRIKRLSSIRHKLQRIQKLRLSDMQDIGGCRAILTSIGYIDKLVKAYEGSDIRHKLDYKDDYIKSPKIRTGYRSIHLIYSYVSDKNTTYNGHRIEIQLRTQLQHAWATAVETVGTFKGQVLKSNQGDSDLLQFFRLMATVIANIEGTPPAPGTPTKQKDLIDALSAYKSQIEMIKHIKQYGEILQTAPEGLKDAHYFLIKLDTVAKRVTIKGFDSKDIKLASEEYLAIERSITDQSNIDAVLVSAESLDSLERAYPNYFIDMKIFLDVLDRTIKF